MSSSDYIRRKLEDLRRKRADAAKNEADARSKQAAVDRSASEYRSKAFRATSPSMTKSYARQAESAEKDSLAAGRQIAERSGKAADIAKEGGRRSQGVGPGAASRGC